MESQLEALTRQRTDLRLRIVDIEAWDSPVAEQYGVNRLPTLWLYSDGERVASETGDVVARLNRLR